MMHTVKQGEHLVSIAAMYGFRSFETVWLDQRNSDLRGLRENPNVLLPGDQVFIPERQEKIEAGATGKLNPFQAKRDKLLLQVVVEDLSGAAQAGTLYFLKVHEDVLSQNTDSNGMTRDEIDAQDRDGDLLISDPRLEFRLKIGSLNPLIESPEDQTDEKTRREAIAAWQDRLNNLGYFAGFTAKDSRQLQWAIEEFQCEHGFNPVKGKPPTGKTDKETRDKLEEVYGC